MNTIEQMPSVLLGNIQIPVYFKPFRQQTKISNFIDDNEFVMINKCRQCGMTTLLILYALKYVSDNPNITISFLSTKQAQSSFIIQRMKQLIVGFPSLKFNVSTNTTIEFSNGSKITTNMYINADIVIIDELAYHREETICNIWEEQIEPRIMSFKKVIISFTPSQYGLLYKRLWGDVRVSKLEIPYTECETSIINQSLEQKSRLADDVWQREYNCKID